MRVALFVFFVGLIVVCNGYNTGPKKCTRPYEVLRCVKDCPPEKTCENRGFQFRCLIDKKCTVKCVCIDGYVRNKTGTCIPVAQCDKCGPNEVFKCRKPCPPEQYKYLGKPIWCDPKQKCVDGCYCRPGFIRCGGRYSPCIPIRQCRIHQGS